MLLQLFEFCPHFLVQALQRRRWHLLLSSSSLPSSEASKFDRQRFSSTFRYADRYHRTYTQAQRSYRGALFQARTSHTIYHWEKDHRKSRLLFPSVRTCAQERHASATSLALPPPYCHSSSTYSHTLFVLHLTLLPTFVYNPRCCTFPPSHS